MDSSHINIYGVGVSGGGKDVGIMVWQQKIPMDGITVNNVSTTGFKTGLYAGTDSTTPAINNLNITNSTFSGAVNNNVHTHSPAGGRGLSNVTVDNVTAHSATGIPGAPQTRDLALSSAA